MSAYRIDFKEQDDVGDQDRVGLSVRLSSPDRDDEENGWTAVMVPRDLLHPRTKEQQRLLGAFLCLTVFHESKGVERTDEDAFPWIAEMYYNLHNNPTVIDVSISRLDGSHDTFLWEDNTSMEDMAQMCEAWQRREALMDNERVSDALVEPAIPRRSPKL